MHSDNYETLIHKHLSNELSAEDKLEFEKWLASSPANRQRLDEAERIWKLTFGFDENEVSEADLDINLDAEIARFKERVEADDWDDNEIHANVYKLPIFRIAAAAAVIFVGVLYVTQTLRQGLKSDTQNTVVETAANELRQVALPDGSTVWLNENSRLSFATAFDTRALSFEGEAFFDITHDASNPFAIQSGSGIIRVLGTSFSIRNRVDDSQLEVTVATGKVSLEGQNGQAKEVLPAGYQGRLNKSTHQVSANPNTNPEFQSWRKRPLQFNETTFNEVVTQLSAHFALVVDTPSAQLAGCTFSGQFDNPSLSEVLDALAFSLDVQISQQNNVYSFSGSGCD